MPSPGPRLVRIPRTKLPLIDAEVFRQQGAIVLSQFPRRTAFNKLLEVCTIAPDDPGQFGEALSVMVGELGKARAHLIR